jgi:hypothetical protein
MIKTSYFKCDSSYCGMSALDKINRFIENMDIHREDIINIVPTGVNGDLRLYYWRGVPK